MSNTKKKPKQPQDHKQRITHTARDQAAAEKIDAEMVEAVAVEVQRTVTVHYDGRDWTIDGAAPRSPEVMYLLAELQTMAEDAQAGATRDDLAAALVTAMTVVRLVFGRQQGRLFARSCPDAESIGERLGEFFEAASAKVGSPDPSNGSPSSDDTSESSKPTSDTATA